MAQFARPSADTVRNTWTDQAAGTTNIYTTIDEVSASDADYIESVSNSTVLYESLLIAVTDPVSSSGHIVRYRYGKNAAAGRQIDVRISLYQGGTEIAFQAHADIGAAFIAGTFTLSGAEADSITNYADLRMIALPSSVGGGAGRKTRISWWELEVPNAPPSGNIKWWSGASWVLKPLKRWNGSSWVAATLKRWNGGSWITEP